MLLLGQYNELEILRFTSVGVYLGDDEGNDVLLPNRYVPENIEIGQKLTVFLYLDHDERLIATTEKPPIELHGFAYLKVVDVNLFGAFLDWGLMKHLFCPFKEQGVKMELDKSYLVYLYLDDATQRLVASAKINKYLEKEHIVLQENDEVDLLVCEKTDLGVKVIINDTYSGLIFKNHISKPIYRGDKIKGYVSGIRPDGKMDISLEPKGFQKVEPAAQELLNILKQLKEESGSGILYLTDKSDPDAVRELVGMSKKTFKQAVGNLYKNRLITIHGDSIELL